MPGPVPERSDRRRRRNKQDVATDTAPAGTPSAVFVAGIVNGDGPKADDTWHPLAREWFDALASSGQSRFYEASDWAEARVCAALMDKLFSADKPSAQLAQTVLAWTTNLMTTEGARRRLRLELARGEQGDADDEASAEALASYATRLGAGG